MRLFLCSLLTILHTVNILSSWEVSCDIAEGPGLMMGSVVSLSAEGSVVIFVGDGDETIG